MGKEKAASRFCGARARDGGSQKECGWNCRRPRAPRVSVVPRGNNRVSEGQVVLGSEGKV